MLQFGACRGNCVTCDTLLGQIAVLVSGAGERGGYTRQVSAAYLRGMPPREGPNPPELEALAAEGARLAAEGAAIEAEVREVLADALLAVVGDQAELARLHPASARDAVAYLVRIGRMTAEEGDAVVRRAGSRA